VLIVVELMMLWASKNLGSGLLLRFAGVVWAGFLFSRFFFDAPVLDEGFKIDGCAVFLCFWGPVRLILDSSGLMAVLLFLL